MNAQKQKTVVSASTYITYVCKYVVVAKHTWATSVTDTVATPPKLSTTDRPNGENPPETKLKLSHN